jgi:2-oxoglutarate dehydrogenase E2 component (dihydrolipoamide succinyltransferase)
MTTTLNVPELGESITSAFIAKWLKQVGEPVAKGESMVELDSDKASLEVPSPAAGRGRRVAREGRRRGRHRCRDRAHR